MDELWRVARLQTIESEAQDFWVSEEEKEQLPEGVVAVEEVLLGFLESRVSSVHAREKTGDGRSRCQDESAAADHSRSSMQVSGEGGHLAL